ncbi:hypothetical protein MRX96_002593 [Rhipicephalus microplus]
MFARKLPERDQLGGIARTCRHSLRSPPEKTRSRDAWATPGERWSTCGGEGETIDGSLVCYLYTAASRQDRHRSESGTASPLSWIMHVRGRRSRHWRATVARCHTRFPLGAFSSSQAILRRQPLDRDRRIASSPSRCRCILA